MIDRYFELRDKQTSLKIEVVAGATTFLTMAYIIFFITAGLLLFCGCKEKKQEDSSSLGGKKMEIKITSSVFSDGGMIPAKYTCDGDDISPPLKWEAVAEGTKSIALICDDPDAPMGTFVHWVLFNLPAGSRELAENFPEDETLPDGTRQGVSSFGKTGYGGPCPPSGVHRYFFKIYALDTNVDIVSVVDKKRLLEAMKGHILGEGQIMCRYKRQ